LQRDLGTEIGVGHDIDQPIPFPKGPIFRQRTASLPHEPDRSVIDWLMPGGLEELGQGENQPTSESVTRRLVGRLRLQR
jgi:hypothetical protein